MHIFLTSTKCFDNGKIKSFKVEIVGIHPIHQISFLVKSVQNCTLSPYLEKTYNKTTYCVYFERSMIMVIFPYGNLASRRSFFVSE